MRTPARIELGDELDRVVYDGGRVVAWITSMPALLHFLGMPGNVYDLTPAAILLGRPGVRVEGHRPENYAVILLEVSPRVVREVSKLLEKLEVSEP